MPSRFGGSCCAYYSVMPLPGGPSSDSATDKSNGSTTTVAPSVAWSDDGDNDDSDDDDRYHDDDDALYDGADDLSDQLPADCSRSKESMLGEGRIFRNLNGFTQNIAVPTTVTHPLPLCHGVAACVCNGSVSDDCCVCC